MIAARSSVDTARDHLESLRSAHDIDTDCDDDGGEDASSPFAKSHAPSD